MNPSAEPLHGRVALVGAGPGDPGLLTRRGADLLARAEVVVYDRLASPRLLDLAPPEALRIDVGKAPGRAGRRSRTRGRGPPRPPCRSRGPSPGRRARRRPA